MRLTSPPAGLKREQFDRAYADMLRRWSGDEDHQVIDLAAPQLSILSDTILECARAAEAMAEHLALSAGERCRRAPLRALVQQFGKAHPRFGFELREAVRLASRAGE